MAKLTQSLAALKNISLSETQVSKMSDTKVLLYSELYKYKTLEELLDHNGGKVIILYLQTDSYGHWTTLIKTTIKNKKNDNECVEWFDPYGLFPDDEFEFSSPEMNEKHKQDYKYITQLLRESPYILSYNHYKFQEKAHNVATCGFWCVNRINNSTLTLEQYKKMIDTNLKMDKELKTRDDVVVILEYQHYKKTLS